MTENQDSSMERARGEVYHFFSTLLLSRPTAEVLARILSEDGLDAIEAMFPEHPACAELRELSRAYQMGQWLPDDFLLDYDALFRVPGDNYVHPFESVYGREGLPAGKGKTRGVLAEQAREVSSIYRRLGLAPREGFTELPDHLAVELELMSVLCRRTAEAMEDGSNPNAARLMSRQHAFLTDHLLKWGPQCLSKVREKGRTPLYVCMADLMRAFLQEESDLSCCLSESASG